MRLLWLAAGFVLVGIGFVGYLVPVMPGTVFILAALACFARSSPRMERWILDHPWFGPMIRDWCDHQGIRAGTKRRIIVTILLACGLSVGLMVRNGRPAWLLACVAGAGLVGVAVVWSRPSPPEKTVRP